MRFKRNEVEPKALNEKKVDDWVEITTTQRVRRRTLQSRHTRLLNRFTKIARNMVALETQIDFLRGEKIRVVSEAKQIELILNPNKEARKACEKAINP